MTTSVLSKNKNIKIQRRPEFFCRYFLLKLWLNYGANSPIYTNGQFHLEWERGGFEIDSDEIVKDTSATRKAIALYLPRLMIVESTVDKLTAKMKQHLKDGEAGLKEIGY